MFTHRRLAFGIALVLVLFLIACGSPSIITSPSPVGPALIPAVPTSTSLPHRRRPEWSAHKAIPLSATATGIKLPSRCITTSEANENGQELGQLPQTQPQRWR